MRIIRIDHPGDGEKIMAPNEGFYRRDYDHSIANHDAFGAFLGGFVITGYLGHSVCIHMAGTSPSWCSRELLWMLFDYVFRSLKCGVAFALIASDNKHALELNIRAGFRHETAVRDAFAPGRDMVVLAMRRETCKWLNYEPKHYRRSTPDGR